MNSHTARFFNNALSLLTIVTMVLPLVSAFPNIVSAATSVFSEASATVSTSTPYSSGSINATGYENLELSFEFNSFALDNEDSFTYDVTVGGVSVASSTVNGVNADTDVFQPVSVDLSAYSEANDIELNVTVSADTSTDEVELTNILLEGDAIGGGAPSVSECTITTEVVSTDLSAWDLSETRATGHNEIENDGLHIWTEGTTSTDKAAGYYDTDFPLHDLGDQTIDEALDYNADQGIEPGLQLVVDFDNNGSIDGILVGEKIYGNNWWLTDSSAQFVKDGAPNNGGGNGSQWFGTPNEWLSEFPDAQVKAIGYSLGSGVHGDGVIKSINLGCAEYTFSKIVATETIVVIDDTSAGENQPGWLFNRDTTTDTPFVFDDEEHSIGDGSIHVLPIGANPADKFVAEYFPNTLMGDIEALSYDFNIGAGGSVTDAEHFYLNVYANFGVSGPTKFYDCRYNIVPSSGIVGDWTTVTFDPSLTYPVTQSGTSPSTCPSSPSDMGDDAFVRAFAINLGDSSLNDQGLDGYFDNVVFETSDKITTFDFEPNPNVDPDNQNILNVSGVKFHNRNGDRDQDTGEENLAGWGMRLYREMSTSTWELVATTTTGVDGVYKFPAQQAAGVYHTCEVAQLGWTQVRQDWSGTQYDVKTDNISPNATEEGPYCTTIVYTDESDKSNAKRIGNLMNDPNDQNQFSQIGIKFNNINGNRGREDGEGVLSGWTFNFYKEVNGVWEFIASAVTAEDGKYSFPQQKAAGIYHVCEVMQPGWQQVYQDWSGTPYHIVTDNQSPNAATEGPWCSTTTYTDEADRSNARYFGNMDLPDPSLTITDPTPDGQILSGTHTFLAEYVDADADLDSVQWAIRAGTCSAGSSTVAGNVDGHSDAYSFDGADFSTTIDMSSWANGDYCLVVNPNEDGGTNFRETRLFTLENPIVVSCVADVNLLANASFEEPSIAGDDEGWELANPVAWLVERVNSTVDVLMEVQRGNTGVITWSASEGDQMIELDGEESSAFSQTISTIEDKQYTLSWDFSARPGRPQGDNQLEVFVNDAEVASAMADGTGLTDSFWTTGSYSFTGDGSDVEITFADGSSSDGYGGLLDNVSLTCSPNTGTINYCGDGSVNGYEQCELGDEGCNNSCQFANQCHDDQLVKITLDDTTATSGSWNGKVYLGDSNKIAPNGFWFSVDEIGAASAVSLATAGFEGLALEYDGSEMKFAWRGENGRGQLDYIQGDIAFQGFDAIVNDDVTREINGTPFKLENLGEGFLDVFETTSTSSLAFDMRADTGIDGATLALRDGEMCVIDPEIPTFEVFGFVWNDENENTEINDGESYRSGVTVSITNGTTTMSTTTDADGRYYFDVDNGNWTVSADIGGDWNFTYPTDNDSEHDIVVTNDAGPFNFGTTEDGSTSSRSGGGGGGDDDSDGVGGGDTTIDTLVNTTGGNPQIAGVTTGNTAFSRGETEDAGPEVKVLGASTSTDDETDDVVEESTTTPKALAAMVDWVDECWYWWLMVFTWIVASGVVYYWKGWSNDPISLMSAQLVFGILGLFGLLSYLVFGGQCALWPSLITMLGSAILYYVNNLELPRTKSVL